MKYRDILAKTNFWGSLKKPYGYTRSEYIESLIKQKDTHNISAIMGVRRAGKSTILLHTLQALIQHSSVKPENTLYINFEDPRLVELLNPNRLFECIDEFDVIADNRSTIYLVLDEIQNVENWEGILRTVLEQRRDIKIYITGSSATLLGKELSTKLSGRYISNEVFPLSYIEFQSITKKIYKSIYSIWRVSGCCAYRG